MSSLITWPRGSWLAGGGLPGWGLDDWFPPTAPLMLFPRQRSSRPWASVAQNSHSSRPGPRKEVRRPWMECSFRSDSLQTWEETVSLLLKARVLEMRSVWTKGDQLKGLRRDGWAPSLFPESPVLQAEPGPGAFAQVLGKWRGSGTPGEGAAGAAQALRRPGDNAPSPHGRVRASWLSLLSGIWGSETTPQQLGVDLFIFFKLLIWFLPSLPVITRGLEKQLELTRGS